jgi:glutamate carboxypeptidase
MFAELGVTKQRFEFEFNPKLQLKLTPVPLTLKISPRTNAKLGIVDSILNKPSFKMNLKNELLNHLSWLDGRDDEMLSLVEGLCNQNSGTYNLQGIEAVRERLLAEFGSLGGRQHDVPVALQETVNDQGSVVQTPLGPAIHLSKRPDAGRQVILCIHMDTVYGLDHPFQKCRRIDEHHLNGPGVIDAKGGLVVMLYALRCFEASPLAQNLGWQVFINPDEEIGSPGTGDYIEKIASTAELALLFEPSLPSGELVSWRKGTGSFSFVVHGRAAHSGREFAKGRNAIAALSRLMVAIDELNRDPEVTYNVGRISGGGPLNIVPDLAIGRVNIRVRTLAQQALVEQELQQLVDDFNSRWDGIKIETHGHFTSPPKIVCEETERLMKRIEACGNLLGESIKWQGSGGASDGNKFSAAGLPNIDSLGPEGGEIHSSNEFLFIPSLIRKARLVALILLSLAKQ